MIFLNAFLLGGALCLLTQFLFRISGRSVIFILTFTLCVGILVTALGWMDLFTGFGQAGMFLLLYGAGEAAYLGMAGLFAGDPVPLLRYLGLLLFCFAIGIGGGVLLHKRNRPSGKEHEGTRKNDEIRDSMQ